MAVASSGSPEKIAHNLGSSGLVPLFPDRHLVCPAVTARGPPTGSLPRHGCPSCHGAIRLRMAWTGCAEASSPTAPLPLFRAPRPPHAAPMQLASTAPCTPAGPCRLSAPSTSSAASPRQMSTSRRSAGWAAQMPAPRWLSRTQVEGVGGGEAALAEGHRRPSWLRPSQSRAGARSPAKRMHARWHGASASCWLLSLPARHASQTWRLQPGTYGAACGVANMQDTGLALLAASETHAWVQPVRTVPPPPLPAVNGLKAARAAGCFAVAVATSLPGHMLEAHADLVLPALTDLDLAAVQQQAQQAAGSAQRGC